jgi:hypothetical protein
MARTVAEIKKTMTDEFMNSTVMATKYGFVVGDSFENTFSKVSFESIQFYVVAFAMAVFEKLFDSHKTEVAELIAAERPHTLIWYKNKALAYMHGYELVADADYYDTTGLTDAELSDAKVVKKASAVEKANVVYVKVASAAAKLSDDQEAGLVAYFKEVKDAGVKLQIINRDADHYRAVLDVYYDPMVLNSAGLNAVTGNETVRDAVNSFIAALEFNGQFRHDALRNSLNALDGVVMTELKVSQISTDGGESYDEIDAYTTPDAGYMKIYEPTDLTLNYKVYATVSD